MGHWTLPFTDALPSPRIPQMRVKGFTDASTAPESDLDVNAQKGALPASDPEGREAQRSRGPLHPTAARSTMPQGQGRRVESRKEQRVERRLAAIFAADVAGYSRL